MLEWVPFNINSPKKHKFWISGRMPQPQTTISDNVDEYIERQSGIIDWNGNPIDIIWRRNKVIDSTVFIHHFNWGNSSFVVDTIITKTGWETQIAGRIFHRLIMTPGINIRKDNSPGIYIDGLKWKFVKRGNSILLSDEI